MEDYLDERSLLVVRIRAAVEIVTEFGPLIELTNNSARLFEVAQEFLIQQLSIEMKEEL